MYYKWSIFNSYVTLCNKLPEGHHKLRIATVATQAVAPSHVAPHVSRARSPAVAPRRQASALGGPALGGRGPGIAWEPSWAGHVQKKRWKNDIWTMASMGWLVPRFSDWLLYVIIPYYTPKWFMILSGNRVPLNQLVNHDFPLKWQWH